MTTLHTPGQPPAPAKVATMLRRALDCARAASIHGLIHAKLHRTRSGEWVKALATELQNLYVDHPDVYVLTRSDPSHRQEFGCNELLHDITVARAASVPTPRHKKLLLSIREVLWQVESEFKRDGRHALYDFNKLVLGSACTKLFIWPDVHVPDSFLATLAEGAAACTGQVYTATVPHPDRWDGPIMSIRVWEFSNAPRGWVERQPSPHGD